MRTSLLALFHQPKAASTIRSFTSRHVARMSTASSSTGRTYSDAINLLNSCQSNAATIEAIRKSGGKMNQYAIPEMIEYLRRIGHEPSDLDRLNVVHITGTKGKGSTSAFVEKIVRGSMIETGILGMSPDKAADTNGSDDGGEWMGGVGLYTSPHLCAVRERIRINGKPLPEPLFAKFFFDVWEKLDAFAPSSSSSDPTSSDADNALSTAHGLNPELPLPLPPHPVYFRLLTLVAFHTFLSLRTKLTVLEVGMGGTYDSTNIVPRPLVTGVTALGLDHTFMLGDTVEEIAKNKGGIYKKGVKAFAIKQDGGKGEKELREKADEAGASSFELVPVYSEIEDVKLGLPGHHQIINASLAISLCKHIFTSPEIPPALSALKATIPPTATSSNLVPPSFIPLLQSTRWPGRCQTVQDPKSLETKWFLDGSHTVESLSCCGEWAFGASGMSDKNEVKRVLVFNCTSGRSAKGLLQALLESGEVALKSRGVGEAQSAQNWFDRVVFCTNVTYTDGGFKGDLTSKAIDPTDLSALATQHALADAWSELVPSFPSDNIHVEPSIEDAIKRIRTMESKAAAVEVLVAGSLHLVGGTMEVAGLAEVALAVD